MKNARISPSIKGFITTSLDPYHDSDYVLSGIPDQTVNPSFCRQFRSRVAVTKPASIGAGGWDLWIISTPWLSLDTVNQAWVHQITFATSAQVGYADQVGPYLVCPVPTGQSWTWAIINGTAAPLGAFDENYEVMRLVGCAFEATNTTAQLYMQGELLAYRSPECEEKDFRCLSAAYTNFPTIAGLHLHPSSVANAQTMCGTVNYAASKGALMVGTQTCPAPFRRYTQNYTPALVSGLTSIGYVPFAAALTPVATAFNNVRPHGCIFTGLSDLSTFTITARINVEVSPNPGSADAFLASMPAPYNAKALATYIEIVSKLPVAVPVDMNSLGDWFRLVMKLAAIAQPHLGLAYEVGSSLVQAYREHNGKRTQTVATAAPRPGKPSGPTQAPLRRLKQTKRR